MKFKKKNFKRSFDGRIFLDIKKSWQENELEILNKMRQISGIDISSDKITCYIDHSTSHGYYGSRTIFLGIKNGTKNRIKMDDALMVISHELFHIYYWRELKKMGLTKSVPGTESKEEWKLAETAAFLLTCEPSLKKIWPSAEVYLYPEIKGVYNKVKKFWKKGDLDYFLVNSYKKIKKER
ncbi:hypothetical protein A3K73_00355 [Candidatus Pacearchaeota archaeon RBG_13_36_9]|nr:MAG: hypothetical protein A3K73_00355 [Candidatus Pacearchaeota archaeon RBG_13_36_9]